MSDLKYCPKCGNKLSSGEIYCPSCGYNLTDRIKAKKAQKPIVLNEDIKSSVKPPQRNVQYCTFLRRFLAWFIDIIFLGIISSIIAGGISLALGFSLLMQLYQSQIITFLLGFLYFWLLEAYNEGQTLGKMALKLRTVDENTLQVADPSKYIINNILKPTPFIIIDVIIGVLAGTDEPEKHRLRIMQKLSNVIVIDER
ncbi:MAG: RDD family protein [Candidatus Lokiarchaeota archaeon]